jgi:hypothetical protein
MLDLRVCGPEVSAALAAHFGAPNDQPLSALVVEGVVSLVRGGVVCRDPYGRAGAIS